MALTVSVQIVFNNVADGVAEALGLREGFGFAAWLRVGERALLFDTGSDGDVLLANLRALSLDPGDLDAVVVSHDHWDHQGGLASLLREAPRHVPVHAPVDAVDSLRRQFPEAAIVTPSPSMAGVSVVPGAWTTEQVIGLYKGGPLPEHALVVDSAEGLIVIVGCSHPGVDALVEAARRARPARPVLLATGGFHLRDANASKIETLAGRLRPIVRHAAPSHCSGELARTIFRAQWGEPFVDMPLGAEFVVEGDGADEPMAVGVAVC